MPGDRVTVYGGPGGENPLLVSSAQRGRAFLGTMIGTVDRPARAGRSPPSSALFATRSSGKGNPPVKSDDVRGTQVSSTEDSHDGYDVQQVDAFLDKAESSWLRCRQPTRWRHDLTAPDPVWRAFMQSGRAFVC